MELPHQNVDMGMDKAHSQTRKDSGLAGEKDRERVRRCLDK